MTRPPSSSSDRRRAVVILVVVLGLRLASSATADLAYLVLAAYAWLGPAECIRALWLSWLITMVNNGIAPDSPYAAVGRYVVIVAAAGSVVVRTRLGSGRVRVPVAATLLLGVFLVAHSALFSQARAVSLLKSISWTVVVATLIAAWARLKDSARGQTEREIVVGLIALMLFSAPLVQATAGYFRNGTGFQGLLNHPQAFGSTLAVLGAWISGRLLGQPRPSWGNVAALGSVVVFIIMTEARTAGFALVAGVPVGVLLAIVLSKVPLRRTLPALFSGRAHALATIAAVCIVLVVPVIGRYVATYVQKRTDQTSTLDVYEASRGRFIRSMWSNIGRHSLSGIGFGVASEPTSMVVVTDPILGIPTGAAVEKGVMPLAVLEELGILGAAAIFGWISMLAYRAGRNGVTTAPVTCVVLATNMGESTLFSPGGMGLLMLILITWSATAETSGVAPSGWPAGEA